MMNQLLKQAWIDEPCLFIMLHYADYTERKSYDLRGWCKGRVRLGSLTLV